MKTALIAFGDFDARKACELFFSCGIEISTVEILSKDDDIGFKRGFENFRDVCDALVISDGAEFYLKEKVAEFCGTALIENDTARKELEDRGVTDFSGALMPADATIIPNDSGAYQGFMTDDREFTLIVLPNGEDFFTCCKKYVLPYFAEKAGVTKRRVFKCFGSKSDAENLLNELKGKFGFDFSVTDNFGDLTVTVLFKKVDSEYRNIVREIAFALRDTCYADDEVSLSETLFTLLKLSGKKISVAESFTGGRVTQAIVKNSGASSYLVEGIVAYSNESKTARLFVPQEDIESQGAVSAKVAYKMAAGLFKSADTDIVVATTGIAGPNGDGTGVPVGRCYIAVGTTRGIHTYKFDFSGDRETVTNKGVNAALYLAAEMIKNI